ncbi:MAG: HAD family phosphatase [Firmicutes bacterium]|nr:HAD family phosphatase [Bacillota bacterium]
MTVDSWLLAWYTEPIERVNCQLSTVNCQLGLFPPHRAAVFDLDGTLLDSMWVWRAVDREFFALRGMELPGDYAEGLQALTFRETAEYTIARFGLPETPEALMAQWNEMSFRQYRDRVRLKPGAKAYLQALRSRGVKLGVATNLTTHVARAVLESNGVLDWFAALTSADEAPRGKSFPDIWLLAARRLGAEPRLCVAYDDVAKSLQGIRAAGMTACAVREPDMPQDWEAMKRDFDCYIESFEG